ncbi:pyruvate formate lyase family protein [Halosquirtibacter xylanolyticus]|uniref:pyruvate formate lyase family protein n=1 Tax=Halosquirtibacter xylanolyticus TaxID=3374599 RepID=UPI0037481772|nr:pyruvate formate lyase family protein [Prolixibacteraceae bacterium]
MKSDIKFLDFPDKMTDNVRALYDHLIQKALGDRSEEWFTEDMFVDLVKRHRSYDDKYPLWRPWQECSVIVRRALAIDAMLKAMTDEKNSEKTHSADILDGDLLLGVLPMGSNGLGKVFPNFLTEDELRAGSITNRNAASLFGHNTMNYEELLRDGLQVKIDDCSFQLDKLSVKIKLQKKEVERIKVKLKLEEKYLDLGKVDSYVAYRLRKEERELINLKKEFDFYWSVKIACRSVVSYADRFAQLAEQKAIKYVEQSDELLELARIARKVPREGADTFHEAMQSICFFHIALHASMNFISLGRLDQVLNPYLEKESDKAKALEIFECFIVKLAGRLNLGSNSLVAQDHVDYATVLGTHPYYIDQKAGVNNFLQNIIVGGKKPDGTDATNSCTFLILQAFENVNLSTPGIYVRLHNDSPSELVRKVSSSVYRTKNNPSVLNDEIMIPAMYKALMQDEDPKDKSVCAEMQQLANDYCVDGCWEPILNGCSDWTFGMINGLKSVETALNQGASLQKDDELLRGAKLAPQTPIPSTYEMLMDNLQNHMRFTVDQAVMALFVYYMMDENAAPSPLFSAYLKGCMRKGRDKASGGADYNIGGVILGGVPDMVNQVAALKKWVYDKQKYSVEEVCSAIRNNYGDGVEHLSSTEKELYDKIRGDFDNHSPKFGTGDLVADFITEKVLNIFHDALMRSAKFGKRLFQDIAPEDKWIEVANLRALAGYYGLPLGMTYDIKMKVTGGMGTFEQYNWSGRGCAASANRSNSEPIAPNFSCVPGTSSSGPLSTMNSLSHFNLSRFAAGVITDVCLEEGACTVEMVEELVRAFVKKDGGMMTVAIGTSKLYKEIYETAKDALLKKEAEAAMMLAPYAGVNVRIGGWQTPFVTLPLSHMENYIKRPENMN